MLKNKDFVRIRLMRIKEILVSYADNVAYDIDSIEYLIDTVDYLLQDKIPLTQAVLDVVIEDVMVASTYHRDKSLLDVVALLQEILESLPCILSE